VLDFHTLLGGLSAGLEAPGAGPDGKLPEALQLRASWEDRLLGGSPGEMQMRLESAVGTTIRSGGTTLHGSRMIRATLEKPIVPYLRSRLVLQLDSSAAKAGTRTRSVRGEFAYDLSSTPDTAQQLLLGLTQSESRPAAPGTTTRLDLRYERSSRDGSLSLGFVHEGRSNAVELRIKASF
jgi:hypothetical protein